MERRNFNQQMLDGYPDDFVNFMKKFEVFLKQVDFKNFVIDKTYKNNTTVDSIKHDFGMKYANILNNDMSKATTREELLTILNKTHENIDPYFFSLYDCLSINGKMLFDALIEKLEKLDNSTGGYGKKSKKKQNKHKKRRSRKHK